MEGIQSELYRACGDLVICDIGMPISVISVDHSLLHGTRFVHRRVIGDCKPTYLVEMAARHALRSLHYWAMGGGESISAGDEISAHSGDFAPVRAIQN